MKKPLPRFAVLLSAAVLLATTLQTITPAVAASATASLIPPARLTDPATISFSSNVWRVTSANVVVRVQETTANLASALSCTNGTGANVSCDLGPVRKVSLKPAAALVPGQRYRLIVNPTEGSPAPVMDYLSASTVGIATRPFIASLFEEETSVAATYAWRTLKTSSAYGGSYQADYLLNATLSFGFTGTSLTWYNVLGPNQGLAAISIDGVSRANVNGYSSTWRYRHALTYRGLSSGYHRVTIRVMGLRGSPNGTGTWVSVDAFSVYSTFVHPSLHFKWQPVASNRASAGHLARAGTKGAQVRFVFRGRSIDWITVTGPAEGSASMYIDGVKKSLVNNHGSATRYGVIRRISNLSDAIHTLDIVNETGFTSVDRFVVRLPDLTIFRGLGTWVDLFDYGTSGGLDAATAAADMHARGVRTIYLETARYNSTSAFDFPTDVGQWVEAAHANGMKIVGWYLPTYYTYLDTDVSRTIAIATYRSPAGQGFDGLGIDIEHKISAQARSAWFADIATHLSRVRTGVTAAFPVGAIIPAPLAMDIYPSSWTGFPWSSIGTNANMVLPMGYWSYRTDCSTDPDHCPYGYAVGNVNEARTRTGGLPVHLIGGIADSVTAQGVKDFMRGAKDARAYGASLYDYRTTTNATFWTIMAGANSL